MPMSEIDLTNGPGVIEANLPATNEHDLEGFLDWFRSRPHVSTEPPKLEFDVRDIAFPSPFVACCELYKHLYQDYMKDDGYWPLVESACGFWPEYVLISHNDERLRMPTLSKKNVGEYFGPGMYAFTPTQDVASLLPLLRYNNATGINRFVIVLKVEEPETSYAIVKDPTAAWGTNQFGLADARYCSAFANRFVFHPRIDLPEDMAFRVERWILPQAARPDGSNEVTADAAFQYLEPVLQSMRNRTLLESTLHKSARITQFGGSELRHGAPWSVGFTSSRAHCRALHDYMQLRLKTHPADLGDREEHGEAWTELLMEKNMDRQVKLRARIDLNSLRNKIAMSRIGGMMALVESTKESHDPRERARFKSAHDDVSAFKLAMEGIFNPIDHE
eukprot:707172_1